VSVLLSTALAQGADSIANGLLPEEVVAGFEHRVDAMFRAESGRPLVRFKKLPPLEPGCWNFAKIAQDRPDYRNLKYNGLTPAGHYRGWNAYFVAYCRERARKGMLIEMMSGIYNFYDSGDSHVRQAAGMFLDLYFAYWAEEQIDGISGGGILRDSYCDPSFIMGTPMCLARPLGDWSANSAKNRWQGVIFAGEHDARIVAVVRPTDNQVAMNQFWSVQSKGSLITQKLKECKGGAEMIVWMSKAGLSSPVEEDGVVFVEAAGAYAAVRVMRGGFKWMKAKFDTERFIPETSTMILNADYNSGIVTISKGERKKVLDFH
jgi:hypothetical protein